MNTPLALSGLLALGVIACSGAKPQQDQQASGSVSGETPPAAAAEPTIPRRRAPISTVADEPTRMAPVAPAQPAQPMPGSRAVVTGTRIDASMRDSVSSQHGRAGQTVIALVSRDVQGGNGDVLIPAGSSVTLTITQIQPAENSSDSDGTVVLAVSSVNVRGTDYQVGADLESVPHVLVSHGVTLGSAEKVGVGAVAGVIAGRIIGRNTRGAVIGGAVGAGAGVIVAAHTQDRDVVVPAGTPIVLVLNRPLLVNR